ncbi:MAG: hypothetical protein LC793_04110 [Thermomicrobia bacterium]|nr:hypothetical protein [Thermomicrobia bacterium]
MTRLGESLSLDLLGYRAIVTTPDGELLAMVAAVFDDLRVADGHAVGEATAYRLGCDDADRWSLVVNDECIYTSVQRADMLVALEWQLVTDLVAHRRDCFHLHAAALADPSGSCGVLVVGVSGSGKTTLALGLMARGFQPYADDVTLITPATLMPRALRRAFHADETTRALSEAMGAPPVWRSVSLPAGYVLPVRWATADVPIRFVLFPTRAPAEPPALVPLSVADAVTALLPYSMTLTHDPALALAVAAQLTRHARCYALSTGDLGATVECVRTLVARECTLTSAP